MEWPKQIVDLALDTARKADPFRRAYTVQECEQPVCTTATILADEVERLRVELGKLGDKLEQLQELLMSLRAL